VRQLRLRVRTRRRGCAGRERRVLGIKQGASPAEYCAGSYGMYSGCLVTGWSAWSCWDANAGVVRRQMGVKFDLTPFIHLFNHLTPFIQSDPIYSIYSHVVLIACCLPVGLSLLSSITTTLKAEVVLSFAFLIADARGEKSVVLHQT
jgi:hypothetical protein